MTSEGLARTTADGHKKSTTKQREVSAKALKLGESLMEHVYTVE